jgi:2-polyprenyl-6-methoxyphenol hydroxylase-like FAD-dependent oxidoreductase
MFIATPLEDQISIMRQDRVRVLIAGAGVAGLTLAQALRASGLHPVLIERSAQGTDAGYMLALMPLVDSVLRQIDVMEEYRASSERFRRYRLHGRHGDVVKEYSMEALLGEFGDYRGIERGDLLNVLASHGVTVTFSTTIEQLNQQADDVRVVLSSGSNDVEAAFDMVVAADGLHSATRGLILGPEAVESFDSHWGGWVAWSEIEPATADLGEEYWGADFFVGLYPVKDRIGIFIGGNETDTAAGPERFVAHIRDSLGKIDARGEQALNAVAKSTNPYYWRLTDCRSERWSAGRVVLLGDAAAGFLPTAGIGAAMAMEAAGVLAQQLGTATATTVPDALLAFERQQRPRTESAQANSRQLARLMFHQGRLLAAMRDAAMRFVPLKLALGPIRKLHTDAPAFEHPI